MNTTPRIGHLPGRDDGARKGAVAERTGRRIPASALLGTRWREPVPVLKADHAWRADSSQNRQKNDKSPTTRPSWDDASGSRFTPGWSRGNSASRRSNEGARRGANVGENADLTVRISSGAHSPAVKYQPDAQSPPLLFGHQRVEIRLNLHGILLGRQSETACKPADVSVDRQTGQVERDASHHICGFAPDPRQRRQVFHLRRDFPAEALHQSRRHPDQVSRLGSEEPGRVDQTFKVVEGSRR